MDKIVKLKNKLLYDECETDEKFPIIVQEAIEILNISDKELCEKFQMTRQTYNQWKNGVAHPFPTMRKYVRKFFLDKIKQLHSPSNNMAS